MSQYSTQSKSSGPSVRMNGQVRYDQVRLLDENREFIGIMSSRDAFFRAKDKGLDLIELSENANPPVCFIGHGDKYLYELKKKEKERKKSNKVVQLKEIQLRPKIAEHDALRKLSDADKFLQEGHRVRIVMQFRGREKARIDESSQRMTKMVTDTISHGKIEGAPSKADGRYSIILIPSHGEKKQVNEQTTAEAVTSVE